MVMGSFGGNWLGAGREGGLIPDPSLCRQMMELNLQGVRLLGPCFKP